MVRKKVKAAEGAAERQRQRRQWGRLRENLVSATTLKRYTEAVKRYYEFAAGIGFKSFNITSEVVHVMEAYIEDLWEFGAPIGHAQDALSGLEHFITTLKPYMRQPRRLLNKWRHLELPQKALPLLREAIEALTQMSLADGDQRLAWSLLAGHVLCLRTIELMKVRFCDITISESNDSLTVYLGYSKSGKRTGKSELARTTDVALIWFTKAIWPTKNHGQTVMSLTETQFRATFARYVKSLGYDPDVARPYSLRRGGATTLFRKGQTFTQIAEHGRWASESSCREYINDAAAELSLMHLSQADRRKAKLLSQRFQAAFE